MTIKYREREAQNNEMTRNGYNFRIDDNFKTRRVEHSTDVIVEFVEFMDHLFTPEKINKYYHQSL